MARRKKKDAKHRLSDMLTSKVDIVDRPANLRPYLAIKNEGSENQMSAPAKTETKKEAMSLPAEARTALIEGVVDALEKITGVTATLKESTVDDDAEVPDALPRMIKEAAEALSKVAQPYLAADGSPQAAAAKPAEGEQKDTEKARSVTPSRLAAIQEARATLDTLLAEIDPSTTSEDPTPAPAPAASGDGATEKATTMLLDAVKFLTGKLDSFGEAHKGANESIEKANKEIAALKAKLAEPGTPNSHQSEDPVAKGDKGDEFTWPEDLSESVVQKMKKAG